MLTIEKFKENLYKTHNGKIELISKNYTIHNQIYKFKCIECGILFERNAKYVIHDKSGCFICNKRTRNLKKYTHIEYVLRIAFKFKGVIQTKEIYKNFDTPITHCCIKHGDFKISPATMLRTKTYLGCYECAKINRHKQLMTEARFQHRLKIKHGNTVKLVSSYINIQAIHTFQCNNGHKWQATADSVVRISGCPVCCRCPSYSKISFQWLKDCERYFNTKLITQETNAREVAIKLPSNKRAFRIDGYDPATKTVYEFYGDYWHGNLQKFRPNTSMVGGLTAAELYQRTLNREQQLLRKGFTVVSVWEQDYKQYLKGLTKILPFSIKRPPLFILRGSIEIRI